jgi:hypothetical protein
LSHRIVALATLAGVSAGALLHVAGYGGIGSDVWAISTAAVLAPLALTVARSLARRDVGVDAIALIAIATALVLGDTDLFLPPHR